MKVLFLCQRECVPYAGGIERVTWTLANAIMSYGLEVCCAAFVPLNLPLKTERPLRHFFFPDKQYDSQNNEDFLVKVIEEEGVELVINQVTNITEVAHLCDRVAQTAKAKWITTFHFEYNDLSKVRRANFFIKSRLGHDLTLWAKDCAGFVKYHLWDKGRFIKKENRRVQRLLSLSDAVVVLSKKALDRYSKMEPSMKDKICYIPNPVDKVDDSIVGSKKKKMQVLYVGRLELGHKRIDRLLDIWNYVESRRPDALLKIVGDGPKRSFLEEKALKLGLKNVVFVGYDNPIKHYQESSVITLCSTSEGLPMVLLEGMQFGCVPVVFDSFDSVRDLISDGKNGCIVESFDKKAFAEKILSLLDDGDAISDMARECQKECDKYDISVIAPQWINLIRQSLKESI